MGPPRVRQIPTQRPLRPETPCWCLLSLEPVTVYSSFRHILNMPTLAQMQLSGPATRPYNYLPNARNAACVVLDPLS